MSYYQKIKETAYVFQEKKTLVRCVLTFDMAHNSNCT